MTKSKAMIALQGTEESKYSLPIPSVLYPASHLSFCYSWQRNTRGLCKLRMTKGAGDYRVEGVGWLRGCFLMAGAELPSSLPMMAKVHSE